MNGLQLDRPPALGSVSVKTVVILPSSAAPGVIQFATPGNITGNFYAFLSFHFIAHTHTHTLLAGWLLKSVEYDDDVALLLSVASLVVGPQVTSESEIGGTDSAALRTSRTCLRLCGSCVTSCTSFFRASDPAIYEAPETSITDSSLYISRTHTFNGPLSRTTCVSRCQKGKTDLGFTEARDSKCQWNQLG